MNVFHHFMQGAAQAAIDSGEPLIDKSLSMILDSGMIFMVEFPDADSYTALRAGAHRVDDPTTYDGIWRQSS